jgi:hypothetical protein
MRKVDNFNPGQWLIENKLTSQSRLIGRKRSTTSEFIEKAQANKKHQNPDGTPKYTYDKVDYVDSDKTPVIITCPKPGHGDFKQTPKNHLKGHGCYSCAAESLGKSRHAKAAAGFIEKAQKRHQNPDGTPKYTYDKVDYVDSNKTPVIITCPKPGHGDFKKTPTDHLNGRGCKYCSYEKKGKAQTALAAARFEKEAQEKHINPDGTPKYTYDKVDYVDSDKTPVIITCPKPGHGDFKKTPINHLSGTGCPRCRESKGESKIHNYLANKYGVDKVVPQKPFKDCNNKHKNLKTCREYEFDFYLPHINTIIEFDGEQHFKRSTFFHKTEEEFLERVEDDLYKNNYCKDKIRLIRISYNEKDIIGQLDKGLESPPNKLWLSDNYPKAGWNQ